MLTNLSTRLLFPLLLLVFLAWDSKVLFAQENTTDTLQVDVPQTSKKENAFMLDNRIIRNAKDSVKVDYATQKAYLYGDASVEYGNITLTAAYIEIDFSANEVFAKGMPDSSGNISGNPVFKEGDDSYETTEIRYNFTTRKGLVSNVTRQEGDAYVYLEEGKKMPDNITYVRKGHFTTCSLPHPHYRIRYGKGKIIPDDKIVTGPIYMEIEDIPLPLILPFGFFPNKKGRSNGILIPSYGYTENRGYFLSNGGYYTGLGEHMDLALRGDIYTRGSWALRALSNYNFRYKASGSINLEYARNKMGETDTDNYTEDQSYFIRWRHRQDAKANPYSNFSANVEFGSTQYNKLNSYNANDYLSNTFQSSIAYSTRIGQNNLSININHSQNTRNHTMNIDLPTLSFSTPRITPFKRQAVVGKAKWYEKIFLTYRLDAKNQLVTADTLLSQTQFEDFRNGIAHEVPISLTLPVGYFSWTNTASFKEYWYLTSVRKFYDPTLINGSDTGGVYTDKMNGFTAGHQASFSSNFSTRIYGMFSFSKGPLKAVRHVMIPTLGFSYRPDVSKLWNYYREYTDDEGNTFRYSIFEGGIFNGPADGKSGAITFSMNNTLEAKVRSRKDTLTGMKKLKILESFNISTSYDLAREEFKLAPLSLNARTTILKQIGVQFRASFDFYAFDTATSQRINEFNWNVEKKLFRRDSWNINFSMNYNLSPSTFDKKKKGKAKTGTRYQSDMGSEQELQQVNQNPEHYVDFNVPWSLNIAYSFVYTDAFNTSTFDYTKTTVQTFNFSGDVNLTSKWKIGFRSGYDFQNKDVSFTSLDIYRDMHCWEMMFNWIPIGPRRSYNLTVRVKSPLLQDLKINKKRDWRDLEL